MALAADQRNARLHRNQLQRVKRLNDGLEAGGSTTSLVCTYLDRLPVGEGGLVAVQCQLLCCFQVSQGRASKASFGEFNVLAAAWT